VVLTQCNAISIAGVVLLSCATVTNAAHIILPQGRQAYYADEAIELAIAGLAADTDITIEIASEETSLSRLRIPVEGDGTTRILRIPEAALAPGNYSIRLDGQDAGKITISSGVVDSTLLLSQTIPWDQLEQAGANFIVGNAFVFGRFTPGGLGPLTDDLRSSRSPGLDAFERAIAADMPSLVYMYWTGYVTHKPFGSNKSWCNPDMIQAMRLLSFHTAQRLRRFGKNIVSTGTLDEPGLGWGKTPTGGTASGFPDWDEKQWYEERGWRFTSDPASRLSEDWMKYMTIRCAILGESNAQAKEDLRMVWQDFVFSTDLYALHAIMDGTDGLNQQVNDIPASHVFLDWGIDRLGVYSGIMLEKSHDPTSKLAHAMNGQLFAEMVPQPGQINAYRAALNGMLAAGLESNWWLNTGGMTPEDLAAVNNPAKRIGPVLQYADQSGHDVAVLWSFTEAAMRQKEMSAREAKKKPGEKIELTVTSLPENSAIESKEMEINAYNIGGDYKEAVLTAHYALSRAGYPAHIIHERLLPDGILRHYRTLVIVDQTFNLPPDVMKAIHDFTANGGKILVDQSTTVGLDQVITVPINLSGLSYRWGALFSQAPETFRTSREASYFQTNYFMDEQVRQAVAPFKAVMKQTSSRPRLETESHELVAECHVAGEGLIYMVINGYEELPEIGDDEKYWIYNYAPYQAEYKLKGIPEGFVVYTLEGIDWTETSELPDPGTAINGSFMPGEMKIYIAAPVKPAGLDVTAEMDNGSLVVTARLRGLKMPWPLTVTVGNPSGKTLYKAYRATGVDGTYQEMFPIGSNAPAGEYEVSINSPLADLAGQAYVDYQPEPMASEFIDDNVRVFDGEAIRAFLASKPELIIALGDESHKATAEKIAADLSGRGFRVDIKPEDQALRKVHYPRVWNPYANVYYATGEEQPLKDIKIDIQITLSTDADGNITAKTDDGRDVRDYWRQPNSLVTIAGEGYVDYIADVETCYEPGVKLHFDQERRMTVIKGELKEEATTEEFKARWAKPWKRLISHVGGYQLPPQLPEAYTTDSHLILLGDSKTSHAVAVLQASDLLLQVVDSAYPGPGKSIISFAWSPFAVEKNVILVGASDRAGLSTGIERLLELALAD